MLWHLVKNRGCVRNSNRDKDLPLISRKSKIEGVPAPARSLPDLNRISVLSATILLAYTLAGLIRVPVRQISTQLSGFYIDIQINIQTIVSLLVVALAISGTNWLLQEYSQESSRFRFEHWLLPALTAWVISIPLSHGMRGTLWWLGILLGGGILMLVLTAEYIVSDKENPYYPIAAIGLTTIAFALFFLLSISLRVAQYRLYLVIPALAIAIMLISLRTLSLKLQGQWLLIASGVCAAVIAELAAAAYYLPFSPITYSLFLLAPAYSIPGLLGALQTGKSLRSALGEFGLILLVFWLLAWWV